MLITIRSIISHPTTPSDAKLKPPPPPQTKRNEPTTKPKSKPKHAQNAGIEKQEKKNRKSSSPNDLQATDAMNAVIKVVSSWQTWRIR